MAGARLEKARQGWRRIKPYLLGLLVLLVVAGAIWALIYVPKMFVPVCPPGKEGLPPKICFDIENEARKTLAYIMGGVLAIIGIYMAHRRIRALERQVLVAQEGQITERFTRAIGQLGSDKMEIRLGGIYALERIANDSDKDYWPIMETLTAYVRERAGLREQPQSSSVHSFLPKTATDIQATLTVLGRRKYSFINGEDHPLDLSETYLKGVDFSGHWEYVLFMNANMNNSDFIFVHLEGAELEGAYLMEADFSYAFMEEAVLKGAHMEGARLNGTKLQGANLSNATGLTRDQLSEAIIDEKTILPDYLQEKRPQDSGPEGDSEE
jgi:hypothetical protein